VNTVLRQQTTQYNKVGEEKSAPVDKRDFWDGRAEEFSEYAASTGYPEKFIRIMRPRKNWKVLDMGCGGGTIAIPLSERVKSIAAVDFSKRMLDIVDWRCRNAGISNVMTIQSRWEDDWGMETDAYDVAIASRSLISDDVKGSITKLNRVARKAVYISTIVGSGPFDKALFESTGRKFNVGKDYLYYYTILYEMGIMANIAFIPEYHHSQWNSHEEALEDQRWMFHGMTEEEEDKVRAYLKRSLVPVLGYWRLPYLRQCYWAIMWWSNDRRSNDKLQDSGAKYTIQSVVSR
jgi:ubiquinone/menaquinone biosynthesis C-methylase UbiE